VASGKVFAVSAPRPEYPYEARRGRITGEGIASLAIDSASGRVLSVVMTKSTGNTLLDQAAIAGFRRWRFRPGAPAAVRCPITYTLTGAMF
jgi:TonB family protein